MSVSLANELFIQNFVLYLAWVKILSFVDFENDMNEEHI